VSGGNTQNSLPSGSASTTQLLSDVGAGAAEPEQALDLGGLIVGPHVEVHPVLHGLVLRHPEEEEVRRDTVLGAAGRRLDHDLVGFLMGTPPPECLLPERSQPLGVGRVDTHALPSDAHGRHRTSIAGRGRPVIRSAVSHMAGRMRRLWLPRLVRRAVAGRADQPD
jgi:hypothetical protein